MGISSNQRYTIRRDGTPSTASQLHAMHQPMPPLLVEDTPQQHAERLGNLLERCADAILLIRDGRIVGCNQAAGEMFSSAGSHLEGHMLDEVVNASENGIPSPIALSYCPATMHRTLQLADGSPIDAEVTVSPYIDVTVSDGRLLVIRDVSARKRIAATLLQQDKYIRLITDTVPALIADVDNEECYRFVNAAYQQWFGRPRNEIVGRKVRDVLGTAYPAAKPFIAQALKGQPVHFELALDSVAGERHVMVVYSPDLQADGRVAGFSAMATDITDRRDHEQALRAQERQLRLITEALPVFIAQCDRDYRLTFVNKTYADRFGFHPKEIVGKRIPEIVGDEAFSTVRQYIDAALRGQPQEHEVNVPLPNGGNQFMQMMYVPDFDEEGNVRGLLAAISDITRLRDTEEQLQRRELEFKTLVENSPDIISRIDRKMRHLYVNPAVTKLAALPPEAYIGKTKAELGLPETVVRAWDEAAYAAFDTGTEQRLDFDLEIEGQIHYFSGRIVPEVDRWGQIDSVIAIAYDVTSRARMEKERDELLARERSARIQAETAAKARDEFLAIVSHELRAPLNGIQSWAHVLENYVQDVVTVPLAQRALQGIKTGVNQQVRLIEDLLDVTRMMSGKFRLMKQPLALLPALQAAVNSVRAMAASKKISLSCNYRITSEQIEGDADRVQQIFWNLLSNAIKFTPEGGHVWLTASIAGEQICVTVRDDGAGISPAFLPHLFNRFSQEDTSSTRDHSGLGLGLFLVRHLVEMHNGQVKADSEGEGKGTTFSVYFKLRPRTEQYLTVGPAEPASNMPLPSLEGRCVLLIDDQDEARESLTVVLSAAGADVFAAATAGEAIEWLSALAPDRYPDVLISDIAMPGEDGYAVLRRIRAWQAPNGSTPLQRLPALALTAFAEREDRIRALTAGFQMHVTKPVAPEELIIVIDTMAARD